MTDRYTADSITSDALDQLYDDLARAEATLARVRKACDSVKAADQGHTPAVGWVVMRVLEAIDARLVNGGGTPVPSGPAADQAARVRAYAQNAIDAGDTGPSPALGRLLLKLLDEPTATQATDPEDEWTGSLIPAPLAEAIRQMDADTTDPHTGLVVQPYRDHGEQKWVFRCWGTDTCDGWLSLDHYSEQSAERARDRHVAEEHGAPAVDEAVRQPGRPEPDDLITAACPHCEARPPRNRLDDHITTEHADLPPCTAHVPDGIGGRKTCALRVGHKDGEYGDWHVSRVDGPMGRWVWNDGAQGAVPHGAGGPPVQWWHTEASTPCDWNVCKQPERLAAGDYGTDPREQH